MIPLRTSNSAIRGSIRNSYPKDVNYLKRKLILSIGYHQKNVVLFGIKLDEGHVAGAEQLQLFAQRSLCGREFSDRNTERANNLRNPDPISWQKATDFGSPPCSPQIPISRFRRTFRPFVMAIRISAPTPSRSKLTKGSSGNNPSST